MKRVGLYVNLGKPDALKRVEHAAKHLRSLGAECCVEPEVKARITPAVAKYLEPVPLNEYDKFADVVISFGGDGTMLRCARTLLHSDIPIMGVNLGKLGFLAEFSVDDVDRALDDMMSGNYRVVDRAALCTHIETEDGEETVYALNEFVIEKYGSSRMITVQAFVEEHHVANYRADGLILTTPTGSTAYSLSCGGPIIAPSSQVLCITPISPHALTLRPLIVPDTNDVSFILGGASDEAALVADGQQIAVLRAGGRITIRKSEYNVKLLKRADSTYFDLLRAKLLWSAGGIQ
ncbi:MAG: NAD(+)/NADH kinase [Candidatus Kapabacteria bacterium]|nr:NAD(+)/NADH kinase [Candidatus Kapabacteria bacterium]